MQVRNATIPQTDEDLTRLAGRFGTEPEAVRHTLRDWLEENPPGFTLIALRHLAQDPKSPLVSVLSTLLSRDELYLFYLTDPGEFTHKDAASVARLLAKRDKRFYVKLTDFAGDDLTDDRVTRILQIAETLGAAGLMVPWLRRMTRHEDPFIRQRAVMIMCQAGNNPLLVERQLQSTDARVRANAVESLWAVSTPAAHALLEYATQDSHHRVALNALVGLFMQGDANAIERIGGHTRSSSPAFRIAAAWALGLTGKAEAWPALNALLSDPIEQVRESAVRALEKVPKPPNAPAHGLQPDESVTPEGHESSGLDLPTPKFRTVR